MQKMLNFTQFAFFCFTFCKNPFKIATLFVIMIAL